MFFDTRSKAFWWEDRLPLEVTSGRLLPKNSVMFLTDSKFILFWNGWIPNSYILILQSSEHVSSLDEGQDRVLRVLEDRRGDIESGKFLHKYEKVQFPGLDQDFLCAKDSAFCAGPTLEDVKRVGGEWLVYEDGPNGGTAIITLNDQYEVVKATILPRDKNTLGHE